MNIEIIFGMIGAVLAIIATAFGIGHVRGSNQTKVESRLQKKQDKAAAIEAVAIRKIQIVKGAGDVQEVINHMGDDDVDYELRKNFSRPDNR